MGNSDREKIELDRELEAQSKQQVATEIGTYIRIIIIAIIFAIILFQVIFINAFVPSGSMESTIDAETHLIGYRLAYLFEEPERGDIVVFKYPVNEDDKYIKRIIGLPGETVEISDGNIYIDGTLLEEGYLTEEWTSYNDGYYYEVPEDSYLLLGDNRSVSLDSRFWASEAISEGLADTEEEAVSYSFVTREQIVAKALFAFWPKIYKIEDYDY